MYVTVLMRLTHRQPPKTPLTSPSALLCCFDDRGRGLPKPSNVENPETSPNAAGYGTLFGKFWHFGIII